MAKWLSIAGIVTGSIGVFVGFYFLFGGAPHLALAIVTATTVGLVGALAFVRHVFFWRSDAERMGWQTDHPDWMWEVGFANLALAIAAFAALMPQWGPAAKSAVVLAYALYLAQAAALNGYRYATDTPRSAARLWRSTILTGAFAALMLFFAFAAR